MSFFYMSPAKGDIPIHLLEKIVTNRLLYLDAILKDDPPQYNEYLVEGSVYDNVGHYMLCVLSILAGNSQFSNYLLKTEEILFRRRLTSMSAYDLRILMKKVLRCLKKQDTVAIHSEPLYTLCQHLILRDVSHHINSVCNRRCCSFVVKVKFKDCLKFVAQRKVELRHGIVLLPCSMWKNYLVELFCDNLKNKLYKTQINSLNSDPRIEQLLGKFNRRFESIGLSPNVKTIKSIDVDKLSSYFPPCMKNLHDTLRSKHRLSHHQRFYYSLFLKDIGMPVDEAMKFWRNEYKQPPQGTHVCSHTWQKDEKKYIYGIRHTYGLEGCRKNYSSGSCYCIQNSDNSISEGGCPFKSFDVKNMQRILGLAENDPDFLRIYELKTKKQYTSACLYFLNKTCSAKSDCDILNLNFSPVNYFNIASNNL